MKNRDAIIRFGVTFGIVFAIYTVLGRLSWHIPGYISIMSQASSFYINASSDLMGGLWGVLWAFGDGFIVGVLWAWLHTQFPKK